MEKRERDELNKRNFIFSRMSLTKDGSLFIGFLCKVIHEPHG